MTGSFRKDFISITLIAPYDITRRACKTSQYRIFICRSVACSENFVEFSTFRINDIAFDGHLSQKNMHQIVWLLGSMERTLKCSLIMY